MMYSERTLLLSLACLWFSSLADSKAGDVFFWRVVDSQVNEIVSIDSGGLLVWSNATSVSTSLVQKTTNLANDSWQDYVEIVSTGTLLSVDISRPNPPPGMVPIPAGSFVM